ncbi:MULTISPECIES: DUF397 domain-containing protein [Nocardiopsis]|uniref:DUF397 domain-containing protein n=1 Tax=Nocardiopsis TaxID=2013 RepID=UPI0009895760|nr:DUF397 domain-containing protein [Nocardiopsis sp. BMP B8015]
MGGTKAFVWGRSTHPDSAGDTNCVEVAGGAPTAVRDTQNREQGHPAFAAAEWAVPVDTLRDHDWPPGPKAVLPHGRPPSFVSSHGDGRLEQMSSILTLRTVWKE